MKLILSCVLVLFVALSCAQSTDGDNEAFSCTANEQFQNDCQSCDCDSTGTYASCSGFACDPDNKSERLKAPENCIDGDKWTDGCNNCFCGNGKFSCTLKLCLTFLGKKPIESEVQNQ